MKLQSYDLHIGGCLVMISGENAEAVGHQIETALGIDPPPKHVKVCPACRKEIAEGDGIKGDMGLYYHQVCWEGTAAGRRQAKEEAELEKIKKKLRRQEMSDKRQRRSGSW